MAYHAQQREYNIESGHLCGLQGGHKVGVKRQENGYNQAKYQRQLHLCISLCVCVAPLTRGVINSC